MVRRGCPIRNQLFVVVDSRSVDDQWRSRDWEGSFGGLQNIMQGLSAILSAQGWYAQYNAIFTIILMLLAQFGHAFAVRDQRHIYKLLAAISRLT